MGKNIVQIQLLGTSFTIQTDEDTAYISKILKYISNNIEDIENTIGLKDPLKISILSNIFTVDEYFKNLNDNFSAATSTELDEAERITLKIIDNIDKSLDDN